MSHITELKTNVQFKDGGLLEEALAAVASTREGCKILHEKDEFVVKWAELQKFRTNSLAFVKRGDEYVTEGDRWRVGKAMDEFLDDLQVAYQQAAVSKWMRQNRFAAPSVKREGKEVVLTARRW